MNAAALRASILQLAIQGKLVPQRDDEPAVEQIGDAPEDVPFAIPEKWKWVSLGSISNRIHYGYTASAEESGNAKLLRITDIQNGSVSWTSVPYCSLEEREIARFRLTPGDLVIARTGGTIGKSFLIAEELEELAVFASYLIRVIPDKLNVNPSYLLNFLDSPCYWEQLSDRSRGTGQPNVNARALSEIKVPLPPLEEQHRIVERLNELLPLVDAYGKAYEALDKLNKELTGELRASLLQEAIQGKLVPQRDDEPAVEQIGDAPEDVPFAIPEKWKWVQLFAVGNVVGGGTPKTSIPEYWNGGDINWFTPADLGKLTGTVAYESERKITALGQQKSSAQLLPEKSILFSSRAPIGYIAIAATPCCTNQGCKSFVPNETLISTMWAYFVMKARTPDMVARASGTTFKEISGKGVGQTWIPLPPIKEQHRIVERLNELLAEVDRLG